MEKSEEGCQVKDPENQKIRAGVILREYETLNPKDISAAG
jgi:hypothetical protein